MQKETSSAWRAASISLTALPVHWHLQRFVQKALDLNRDIWFFQCLQHTLDLPKEQWRVLDQAHRKRNLAEYEGEMDVDEQLVEAMLRVIQEVEQRVVSLLDVDTLN